MGNVLRVMDGATVELHGWTPVGRAPTAIWRIEESRVSGAHAVLFWTGEGWVIQDLASRNGTFVDGQRVEAGRKTALVTGTTLRFGAEGADWILADASAPAARAEPLEGGPSVRDRGRVLALPDGEEPVALVFPVGDGWVLEQQGEQQGVANGETVSIAGRLFRLLLPMLLPSTEAASAAPRLGEARLGFRVSSNEEHVEIELSHPGGLLTIPPRAHHYMLLTLARARLRDRGKGVGPAEEGWEDVELLSRKLGVSSNAFHVQLCRARAQLSGLGVEDASSLVERRSGGRVRLGVDRLEITRLE